MEDNRFNKKLKINVTRIQQLMGNSDDLIIRELIITNRKEVCLFFLDGMVDKKSVDRIISSLLDRTHSLQVTMQSLAECVLNNGEVKRIDSIDNAIDSILSGSLLVLMDGETEGILMSIPGWEERSLTESTIQTVIKGPKDSFNETLGTNTTLVRRRIKDRRIRLNKLKVGSLTKTDIAIMYIHGLADDQLIEQLISRLNRITTSRVLEGEYIEEILREHKQQTIFPTFYNTDRPDFIAGGILEGKIAIFIDGSPFVLLVPAFFTDFMKAADDYYQAYIYVNFLRLLRYLALFISLLAPAIYIALTTHHQDMIPTTLLLSLAAQREGVPFPAFVEALMMEIIFEILREAGIRMPRTVGQAVSIVGTLVIGQAAVDAGIVSAVMVIIVAITAISSFVIPSYSLAIAIRLLRFGFMILAGLLGMYGLTIGMILLVLHLSSLQSFGLSYMRPFAPFNQGKQEDSVLRFPFRGFNQSNRSRIK